MIETIHGKRVLFAAADGRVLQVERDALDLIGATYGEDIDTVALPITRLADEFFALRTGLAGGITQKFANSRIRLIIVGDVSQHIADAFRDFVIECNRGRQLGFVANREELEARLSG